MVQQTSPTRTLTRDARIWGALTGQKHTAALRDLESPWLRGILGPRINMTDIERVLLEQTQLGWGGNGTEPLLTPERTLDVHNKQGFLMTVAMSAEILRLLSRSDDAPNREQVLVSSYSLKHLAEDMLDPEFGYFSNGSMILAAHILNLAPEQETFGPNVDIIVDCGYYQYLTNLFRQPKREMSFTYHQPVLWGQFVSNVPVRNHKAPLTFESDLNRFPDPGEFPFFDWLIEQHEMNRQDEVGNLLEHYFYGLSMSEDPIVRSPQELIDLLEPHTSKVVEAVHPLAEEWYSRSR